MPFGLCNAPSTFQRLMQQIFGDQQCQSLLLYLDNIVVFSSTIEQHLERLSVVLGRLQREGLKVKLSKCAFFQQLEFLALKWAMTEKFCEYLLGHKCVVYADNNPLSHLSSAKL